MKGVGRKVGNESELFGLLLLKTQKKIKKKKIKLHELRWIIGMSGKYKFGRKTDWSLRDLTVHYNTPHPHGGLLIVTDVNGKPAGTRYASKRRHLSQEQVFRRLPMPGISLYLQRYLEFRTKTEIWGSSFI